MLKSKHIYYLDYYLWFLFWSDIIVAFSPLTAVSYLRGAITLVYMIWLLPKVLPARLNKYPLPAALVVVYAIYCFLLIFIARDLFISTYNYIRAFQALLLFPAAYFIFRSEQHIDVFARSFINLVIAASLYLMLSYFLGIGATQRYTLDFAAGRVNLNTLTYLIILTPAFAIRLNLRNYPVKNYLVMATLLFAIFIAVSSVKRTTIFFIALSFVLYLLFTPREYKNQFRKATVFLVFVLFLTSSFYYDTIATRLSVRQDAYGVENLEQEGRILELKVVYRETFSFHDLRYSLIGRNVFDTPGSYGGSEFGHSFNPRRIIHNDFALIPNSTGIIGLLIYLNFLYLLGKRALKMIISKKTDSQYAFLFTLMFIISTLLMINGAFFSITHRAIPLIIMGAMARGYNPEIDTLRKKIEDIKTKKGTN